LARDVVRLMDHLELERADVMGYSDGGFITLRLLADAPQFEQSDHRRRRRELLSPHDRQQRCDRAGLRAPTARDVKEAVPRQFACFAEQGRTISKRWRCA